MINDYKKQIETAAKICRNTSKKSGVSFEDLFSEALDKLPRISENYIPELGTNFNRYLKTSIAGYLKNYIRDSSFNIKIPRRVTDIYMKTKRYVSPYIASQHTKYSVEDIEAAHNSVKMYRSYNTQELQSWTTEVDTFCDNNPMHDVIELFNELGDSVNMPMLLDYFVYGKTEDEIESIYGSGAYDKLQEQTTKVKELAQTQGFY